jgi:hypothetical protein
MEPVWAICYRPTGDAHAWVEALLPESGWTRFDPTPPAPPSDRPWTGRVEHYLDSLRTGWDRYVLDFSLGDQHAAIERAEAGWEQLRTSVTSGLASVRRRVERVSDAGWLIGGLAALVAFIIMTLHDDACGGRTSSPAVRQASIAFYQRLLRILEQRGIVKTSAATPLEFAMHHTSQLHCTEAILARHGTVL